MCQYYENSYCTIAAAYAQDSSEGFLTRPAESYPVFNIIGLEPWDDPSSSATPPGIRTVVVFPAIPNWKEVSSAPLFERGWAFQERALSPRVLHWSRSCVWWECSHKRYSEFSPNVENERGARMSEEEMNTQLNKLLALPKAEALGSCWFEMVHLYSATSLSFESDRLIAIQGLVDKIQKQKRLSDDYHFGLWRSNLLPGLCSQFDRFRPRRRMALPCSVPCAPPSWSWASYPGRVTYSSLRSDQQFFAEVITVGGSSNSSLHIRGVMETHPFAEQEPPIKIQRDNKVSTGGCQATRCFPENSF